MYVYIQCSHTKYIWSVLHKNTSNILTLIRPLFGGYPEHQKLSRNAPFNILQQNGCLFKLGIPSKWHFSYGTTANLRPLNFRDQSSKNTLLVTYIYTRLYTQYISISHYILMIYLEYVHPWMVFPILIDQKPKTVFLLAVPFSMQKNAFSHDFPMIPH